MDGRRACASWLPPVLLDQLHRPLETVGVGADEVVECIQPGKLRRCIQALVAHQASYQGPVLLLRMAVVVLVFRPRARRRYLGLPAPLDQVPVQEFAAVVRMHAQQGEPQLSADML